MKKIHYLALSAVVIAFIAIFMARGNSVDEPKGSDTAPVSATIETRIDEGISALDVRITPLALVEDSRCPIDVTCIQAGTVRLRARIESGLGTSTMIFAIGQPITTEAEEITLTEVRPAKNAGIELSLSDYRFIFTITKRP